MFHYKNYISTIFYILITFTFLIFPTASDEQLELPIIEILNNNEWTSEYFLKNKQNVSIRLNNTSTTNATATWEIEDKEYSGNQITVPTFSSNPVTIKTRLSTPNQTLFEEEIDLLVLPKLEIVETYPNPKNNTEQEWVKIKLKDTVENIDSIDWTTYYITDKTQKVHPTTKENFIVNNDSTVTFFPNIILNNSKEKIFLYHISGILLDSKEYSTSTQGEIINFQKQKQETKETRKKENKKRQTYTKNIKITEIYPSPLRGEEEWIEIFNFGEERVTLKNWKIKDQTSSQTLSNFWIKPNSYKVIKSLKITLNNEGDTISLENPNKKLVDTASYESTQKGLSISQTEDTWKETKDPTPGFENNIVSTDNHFYKTKLYSIQNLREGINTFYTEGKVTYKTDSYLIIQNEKSGIKVNYEWAENIKLGSNIKVTGEYDHSTKVISTKEEQMIQPTNSDISINFTDIEAPVLYSSLKLSGDITKINTKSFKINTNGNAIVLVKSPNLSNLSLEDTVEIEGIISKTSPSIELLELSRQIITPQPTNQEEVKLHSENNIEGEEILKKQAKFIRNKDTNDTQINYSTNFKNQKFTPEIPEELSKQIGISDYFYFICSIIFFKLLFIFENFAKT